MSTYSFLVEVAGFNPQTDKFVDDLYEAGCDDALIIKEGDHLLLDFDREAPSYDAAVTSAKDDVMRAGGDVVRVLRGED